MAAKVAEAIKAQRDELMKPPADLCPICWRRHGRALLRDKCACTGHVKLGRVDLSNVIPSHHDY